jgi:hypothetical protein
VGVGGGGGGYKAQRWIQGSRECKGSRGDCNHSRLSAKQPEGSRGECTQKLTGREQTKGSRGKVQTDKATTIPQHWQQQKSDTGVPGSNTPRVRIPFQDCDPPTTQSHGYSLLGFPPHAFPQWFNDP